MTPQAISTGTSATRPSVWIVDDSPLEAELVRRALSSVYRVEIFTDGASVIEQFASEAPPDAVVLDWRMPGISGIDVCQFLRGRPQTQAIPILMLTAQHDTQDLVQCLAAGADDFLAKPCNAAELSARIAALVRSKQMHERVVAAEHAVRSLLMQLPEGVISVGAPGTITFVNLEAQRMLGAEAAAIVGRPLAQVLAGISTEVLVSAAADGQPLPDLVLNDRVYAPAVRRYAGVDATETTLSLRDVTAERRHAAERASLLAAERAARTQAEEASRAKDEFLAVVSHELRTPLNAIVGWTRLVRSGTLSAEKRERALETVERNAAAQQRLIEDILDASRIISGKMSLESTEVDLTHAVRTSLDALRPNADAKSIELTLEAPEPGPVVIGDANRLQQVVSNLLSNAVKFTAKGGAVSVSVTESQKTAVICVRDTGQGIRGTLLPHVFDRFRQGDTGASRAHGGLGLGLSIVKHLVERQGGTVAAESPGVGQGATFTVRLPLAALEGGRAPRVAAVSAAPSITGPRRLEGVHVLVVDDERDARELLVTIFQQLGAEATAVSCVNEALEAIRRQRPTVIVSDIGMPTEDGYALVRRLRALPEDEGGRTPAIALTAFAAQRDARLTLEAGFSAYLAKPVDPEQLVGVVAKLTSRG